MKNLKFYAIVYHKDSLRIASMTPYTGPTTSMKKGIVERNHKYKLRNDQSMIVFDVIALRDDLAKYYLTRLNGELYLDRNMLNWYPPNARGRKPASFYTKTDPTVDYIDVKPNVMRCASCGQKIKIQKS